MKETNRYLKKYINNFSLPILGKFFVTKKFITNIHFA